MTLYKRGTNHPPLAWHAFEEKQQNNWKIYTSWGLLRLICTLCFLSSLCTKKPNGLLILQMLWSWTWFISLQAKLKSFSSTTTHLWTTENSFLQGNSSFRLQTLNHHIPTEKKFRPPPALYLAGPGCSSSVSSELHNTVSFTIHLGHPVAWETPVDLGADLGKCRVWEEGAQQGCHCREYTLWSVHLFQKN